LPYFRSNLLVVGLTILEHAHTDAPQPPCALPGRCDPSHLPDSARGPAVRHLRSVSSTTTRTLENDPLKTWPRFSATIHRGLSRHESFPTDSSLGRLPRAGFVRLSSVLALQKLKAEQRELRSILAAFTADEGLGPLHLVLVVLPAISQT